MRFFRPALPYPVCSSVRRNCGEAGTRAACAVHRPASSVKLILFFLLAGWGIAQAQLPDYHLQLFDYSSGIRPGTIRSVIRDNKGFLWILHFRSVQRFDGRKVINFRVKGTFTHLFCDRSNRVWISGTDRVYFYDEDLRDFTEVPPPAKDSAGMLGDLFQLPDQEVSLQTSSGFLEFQPDTRRFVPSIRITPPLPRPFSARVFAVCRHTLFFRNRAWIYRYDTREGRLDSLPDRNLQAIFALNAESYASQLGFKYPALCFSARFKKLQKFLKPGEPLRPSSARPTHLPF